MEIAYRWLCPVCNGTLTTEEIRRGVCSKTGERLDKRYVIEEYEEYKRFFTSHFNKEISRLQRVWAKRVLRNESFAIESPPGTGKSTFGIAMASFLSMKGKKCYIIVPTTNLVKQTSERIIGKAKVIAYHKDVKDKEKILQEIEEGKFDILITTATFLVKHFDKIKDKIFDFIFVDDLDAVLKGSKNIDKIIYLLGYNRKTKLQNKTKKGILVIATATSKPGKATIKLREVLGIDASSSTRFIRNVEDYYIISEEKEKLLEIIRTLKDGIIVYTNTEEEVKEILEFLKNENVKVGEAEDFEDFKEGKINVLVGVAAPYGKVVRGIDLPQRIKYALFYKSPFTKLPLDVDNLNDKQVIVMFKLLREHPKIAKKYFELIQTQKIEEMKEIIREVLKEGIKQYVGSWAIIDENYIHIPNLSVYIQASGRTSRMYAGGLTKGLSIIIDSKERIEVFRARADIYDIELKEWNYEEVKKRIEEIEEERREMKDRREFKDVVIPALMVVESPTKAKQISRFYGKPAIKRVGEQVFYEIFTGKYVLLITASLGHVVDLTTKDYYHGVLVNPSKRKIMPFYGSIKRCVDKNVQYVDEDKKCEEVKDSKQIIENIRRMGYDEELIIIATDPDTEGEKIAKDISNLSSFVKTKRAEFHEITKNAVDKALNELREIDELQVSAQIVRRVEDRWIGFELSSILREKFSNPYLSAGRVQTPVLGWIIKAYDESKEMIRKSIINIQNVKIVVDEELEEGEHEFEIKIKEIKESIAKPLPPYTTDEVLKDINKILRIGSDKAMQILQRLFENGLITYHRTDSTRVSERGLEIAKIYLEEDFRPRKWEKGGEGAHECIRPTKALTKDQLKSLMDQGVIKVTEPLKDMDLKVYDLIFRRFMASQSPEIRFKEISYAISIDEKKEIIKKANCCYDGKAYTLYPYPYTSLKLEEGKYRGEIKNIDVPKRLPLTQGEVIGMMREKNIGRPSTYATIIHKLLMRKYVIERGGRLIPTKLGREVYEFLINNYSKFVSEETTRNIYKIMEKVESGERDAEEVLLSIYEEMKEIKEMRS